MVLDAYGQDEVCRSEQRPARVEVEVLSAVIDAIISGQGELLSPSTFRFTHPGQRSRVGVRKAGSHEAGRYTTNPGSQYGSVISWFSLPVSFLCLCPLSTENLGCHFGMFRQLDHC